jgi:DNA-binding transcriptional LysR family regulator
MIDIRRLQIFVAVADEGSFTAAAQRLYLTQSAVSQQMATLEREIGVSLLRRMPRGVRLTPAGDVLATRAKGLFAEIATIEQEVHTFGDGPQEIMLGAFATAGVELLPVALKAFKVRCPDVRVQLSSVYTDDAINRLRDGDIHVLLTWEYDFAPQPMVGSVAQLRLTDDPLLVVLPADHALAREDQVRLVDLAADRWVVRSHRPPYEDAYETMCRIAGFEPDVAFRTDDYQSLQGLVAAGMGVSLIPQLSLTAHRDDVVIRPLRTPTFARRVTAMTLPEAGRAGPVADFLDTLRTTAQEVFPHEAEPAPFALDRTAQHWG